MQTFRWSRKLLGKSIPYRVEAKENKDAQLMYVSVYCLQPKLLFDMLSNTPQLIAKQLLNLALDAAGKIHRHYLLQDTISSSYNEEQISLVCSFCLLR